MSVMSKEQYKTAILTQVKALERIADALERLLKYTEMNL